MSIFDELPDPLNGLEAWGSNKEKIGRGRPQVSPGRVCNVKDHHHLTQHYDVMLMSQTLGDKGIILPECRRLLQSAGFDGVGEYYPLEDGTPVHVLHQEGVLSDGIIIGSGYSSGDFFDLFVEGKGAKPLTHYDGPQGIREANQASLYPPREAQPDGIFSISGSKVLTTDFDDARYHRERLDKIKARPQIGGAQIRTPGGDNVTYATGTFGALSDKNILFYTNSGNESKCTLLMKHAAYYTAQYKLLLKALGIDENAVKAPLSDIPSSVDGSQGDDTITGSKGNATPTGGVGGDTPIGGSGGGGGGVPQGGTASDTLSPYCCWKESITEAPPGDTVTGGTPGGGGAPLVGGINNDHLFFSVSTRDLLTSNTNDLLALTMKSETPSSSFNEGDLGKPGSPPLEIDTPSPPERRQSPTSTSSPPSLTSPSPPPSPQGLPQGAQAKPGDAAQQTEAAEKLLQEAESSVPALINSITGKPQTVTTSLNLSPLVQGGINFGEPLPIEYHVDQSYKLAKLYTAAATECTKMAAAAKAAAEAAAAAQAAQGALPEGTAIPGAAPGRSPCSLDAASILGSLENKPDAFLVKQIGGGVVTDYESTARKPVASAIKAVVADMVLTSRLSGSITITPEFLAGGETQLSVGQAYTIDHLMNLMLGDSNNTASNALVWALSGKTRGPNPGAPSPTINALLTSRGYANTQYNRYLSWAGANSAWNALPTNFSTAADLTLAVERLVLSNNQSALNPMKTSMTASGSRSIGGGAARILYSKLGYNSNTASSISVIVIKGRKYIVTSIKNNVDGTTQRGKSFSVGLLEEIVKRILECHAKNLLT